MGKAWRIILDSFYDPFYNMAKDEAILFSYKLNLVPTLRVYSWSFPSITLGYKQKAQEVLNIEKCYKENVPFVRRITGGGAILHCQELTYCIVCSKNDLEIPYNIKESYKRLNSFIIRFYKSLGLEAFFALENNPAIRAKRVDFCLSSCEPFDIVIDGRKIGGNAQRRLKDIIFQQGFIPFVVKWDLVQRLFKNNPLSSNLRTTSLNEIAGRNNEFISLCKTFIKTFIDTFRISFNFRDITDEEKTILNELIESKYTQDKWNLNY